MTGAYTLQSHILNFVSSDRPSWISSIADLNKEQEQSLKFHIHAQDYFGTLATVLNCLQDEDFTKTFQATHLETLVDELMLLQEEYTIMEKK